jgi:beta-mannosidase
MMFGYRGWRRQWGDERHCGGALLWQLNDCWPTISWAIVDYFLNPKPAYYAVKRVLNPIAIGVRREHHDWTEAHAKLLTKSKYELWIASNKPYTANGSIELRFLSVNTGRDVRAPIVHENIEIVANGTTDIITNGELDYVADPEPCVLAARLWVDNQIVARDFDWPQPFKYLDLTNRGVDIQVQRHFSGDATVVINARKPVKCLVFEEQEGIKLSDNAIDVVPGDAQTVTVTGLQSRTLKYRFLGQVKCDVIQ